MVRKRKQERRDGVARAGPGVRALARLDAWANALWGWRGNPLYHSGAVVVLLLMVLLVTGLYLIFFYRLGSPYGSIERLNGQVWTGRWVRALHRYASDAALIAVGVHAVRLFLQRRTWGPRALAWLSGLVLTGLVLVCGWTGYVMVWDTQGQVLAHAGARLLDGLPLFAEPLVRSFSGEHPVPTAFFFLNLFAHVALPVGLLLVLWLHVSRVARPGLTPPRRLTLWLSGWLLVASVAWPAALGPEANALRVPQDVPLDVVYNFWIPWATMAPVWSMWAVLVVIGGGLAAVPWWRRPPAGRPEPSRVDERLCTACVQCSLDCPYEAIAMVARTDGRAGMVARVDPVLCVSCGICAGSCAPMGVGPPGRTGRDQLAGVQSFIARQGALQDRLVLVACAHSAAGEHTSFDGACVYLAACAGSVHTSVVEYLVRAGAAGVMVVSCPPRDCWNREGPKWLEQRLYHEREAELKARVDRARVRLVHAGNGEGAKLSREIESLRSALARAPAPDAQDDIDVLSLCERVEEGGVPT